MEAMSRVARNVGKDPRVQALRCSSCHRLRPIVRADDSKTWNCACGSLQFESTGVHPDEEQLALKLYQREIEERNLFQRIGKKILAGELK